MDDLFSAVSKRPKAHSTRSPRSLKAKAHAVLQIAEPSTRARVRSWRREVRVDTLCDLAQERWIEKQRHYVDDITCVVATLSVGILKFFFCGERGPCVTSAAVAAAAEAAVAR